MSTFIYYGGSGILAHPTGQPIPLFSKVDNQVRYNSRWNTTSTATLQGSLTGCTHAAILSAQQKVLNIFGKDFQELSIVENGVKLYSQNYNIIRDINFDSSSMVGLVNYTVTLESQPQNLFSGVFGVTSPSHEWEFSEDENKLLNVTHKISAKGFSTSNGNSNAFDNAKNYVLSLTGTNSFVPPFFANYCSGTSMCVSELKENINRFENSYGVEEKYVPLDLFHGSAGYIRSVAEYQCDTLKGIASLSLNGEVKSCKNADLATLRSKYQNFDVFGTALTAYSEACGRIDLNKDFLSSGISENPYSKTISFNLNFDNDFSPRTHLEYATEIRVDESDITTVGIKGTIKSRGDLKIKYALVEDYFNTQLNLFNLVNQSYTEFCDGNVIYPLRNNQLNYSVSKNSYIGEISVSASYDNRPLIPPEFQYLEYSLNWRPAITQIRSNPLVESCDGSDYYTVSLGYANRAEFSINGRAVGACNGTEASTVAAINNLESSNIASYGGGRLFLDKHSLKHSNGGKGLGFDFSKSWSFDGTSVISSPFSSVSSL